MPDENFVIQVILRARDEMGNILNKASREMGDFEKAQNAAGQRMGQFNRNIANMRKELNQLTSAAEKTRRGIRSVGGEDIKIKMDLDDAPLQRKIKGLTETVQKHVQSLEETRVKRERLTKEYEAKTLAEQSLMDRRYKAELAALDDVIKRRENLIKGGTTQILDWESQIHQIDVTRDKLRQLDQDLERTVNKRQKTGRIGASGDVLAADIQRIRKEMEAIGDVDIDDRIRLFEQRAAAFGDTATSSFNRAGTAARRMGGGIREGERSFRGLRASIERSRQFMDRHTESVAKFDNEIRGIRVLIIVAQLQALVTAALAAGGALTGLAGSAAAAGAAIGGTLAAGIAQAVPALGLLAATMFRLKDVFDVVEQAEQAREARATQATSSTNQQADATDRLIGAQDTLRDANERVTDAQRGVAEAHRQARLEAAELRHELEELLLTQRSQSLQGEMAEDRVRQLRAQGVTGFELREAELAVSEGALQRRQTTRQISTTRGALRDRSVPENVRDAQRTLRDAQQSLDSARRGMRGAQRDVAEGGVATVAAARQLQFLQEQLSASELRLVKSIQRIKDTFREVSQPITDTVIDAFSRAITGAEEVLRNPRLGKAFEGLGNQVASQIDRLTAFGTGDRSQDFFVSMTDELNKNLQPATTAAIRLSRAFMNIAEVAAPVLNRLLRQFAEFTGRVERVTEDRRGMRELFEFGEKNLQAWLDLAGAIGRTIKAIFAPGGDLERGAGASGLRQLTDLTERFNRAARYINDNPIKVDEFFKESEATMKIILDLLIEIGKTLFRIFDPASVQAFADVVTALLPSFELVAEVMGTFTKALAALLELPGAREAFSTGFGLLILSSVFGRLFSVFKPFITGIQTAVLGAARLRAAISALPGGIAAATAAWRNYGVVAANAQRAAVGGAVVGGVGRGAVQAPAGRAPGLIPIPGVRSGPQAPAPAPASGLRAGITGAAVAAGGVAARGARGLGRFVLPIAGLFALMDFVTASGDLYDRSRAAVRGATFGLVNLPERDPGAGLRARRERALQEGGIDSRQFRREELVQQVSDPSRARRLLQGAQTPEEVERLSKAIASAAKEAEKFGDAELAKELKEVGDSAVQVRTRLGERAIDPDDILNEETLGRVLGRMRRLRIQGGESVEGIERAVRLNAARISDSLEQGSASWANVMQRNFSAGIQGVSQAMEDGKISVKDGMDAIERLSEQRMKLTRKHMEEQSFAGRAALARNFRRARLAAEEQLGTIETATGEGLQTIKKLLASELRLYGLDASQIRNYIQGRRDRNKQRSIWGGADEGGGGNRNFADAAGGIVGQKGERGSDIHHRVLGAGEAVLNWGHQRVVEPALNAMYGFGLSDMFKRTRGRHAEGGDMARGGYVSGAIPPADPSMRALAQRLFNRGFSATSGFRADSTTFHGPNLIPGGAATDWGDSFNDLRKLAGVLMPIKNQLNELLGPAAYMGLYNFGRKFSDPGLQAAHEDHIHVAVTNKIKGALGRGFGGALGRQMGRIPRVEMRGLKGPFGAIGQAVLDVGRRGAQRRANEIARKDQGLTGIPKDGVLSRSQVAAIFRRAFAIANVDPGGGNLADLMNLAHEESTWNPGAVNRTAAGLAAGLPQGILQTVTSTFNAYKMKGYGDIFNPLHNAIASIRYQMSRYGDIQRHAPYARGGIIPGREGAPFPILAHGKEWVLNKGQQMKAAMLAGMDPDKLKERLGFTGGAGSYQGGGDTADETPRIFELPDFPPISLKGIGEVIKDLFRHIKKLDLEGQKAIRAVNDNLDILTREDGLLDQMEAALDERITQLQTNLILRTFGLKKGRVSERLDPVEQAQENLQVLRAETRGIRRLDRTINRGFRQLRPQFRALRADGIDEDEEELLLDLRTQRRNLQLRRRNLRGRRAENIQGRFEAQEAIREAIFARQEERVQRRLRPTERRLGGIDLRQRIAQAFGRGGEVGFIDDQAAALTDQRVVLDEELKKAKGKKNTELRRQLKEQIDELDTRMQELTAQRLQAQVEVAQASFGRRMGLIDFRERFAAATGAISLDRFVPGVGSRRQVFHERGAAIAGHIQALDAFRSQALQQNNIAVLEQLNEEIQGLTIQLQENTRALFLARIEDVNRTFDITSRSASTRQRIAQVQETLGLIGGVASRDRQINELNIVGQALLTQGQGLTSLLADAIAAGDEESIINLQQAILDNELAVLENTLAIKELDGSLNNTQTFTTTSWNWFREAVFNGANQLLPQYQFAPASIVPVGAPNSMFAPGQATGTANPNGIDVTVIEAGHSDDPVYLANLIGFNVDGVLSNNSTAEGTW